MTETDSLMTIQEVAESLRMGVQQVRYLIKAGRLPAVRVGLGTKQERWRIRRSDLNGWLDEQTVGRR